MRIIILLFLLLPFAGTAQNKFNTQKAIKSMVLANEYFMQQWPDPSEKIVSDKVRTSNLWTRGVYYEGLIDFYQIKPDPSYLKYTLDWAEGNNWSLRFGKDSRHADPMCAAQTYLFLYEQQPESRKIADLEFAVNKIVNSDKSDDWTWIDALQMAMPVFAKLSVLKNDPKYSERMYDLFRHTKIIEGGGLYNTEEKLWWRDKDFVPPYQTPGGRNCYWSRGNGWVILALARVMDILPNTDPHYYEYQQTFVEMMAALLPLQRQDGFWNVSLTDETDFGGPELSGTALFAYGMAWGINKGILDKNIYKKPAIRAWNAMLSTCLHKNGMLGYVQGTGKEPKDGQPLSFDKKANFEDYGLGCFLLAGTHLVKLHQK